MEELGFVSELQIDTVRCKRSKVAHQDDEMQVLGDRKVVFPLAVRPTDVMTAVRRRLT